MNIDDYLGVTRKEYKYISPNDSKLGDVSNYITDLVQNFVGADCIFIKSDKARYEFVHANGRQICICDRQADLYFSCLSIGIEREDIGGFERILESSFFIAANILFFKGFYGIANSIMEDHVRTNFHNCLNLQDHMSRQFFEIFHECSHVKFVNDPEGAEHDMRWLARQAFLQAVPAVSEHDKDFERFSKEDELECACDAFALCAGANFLFENNGIEDELMMVAGTGGLYGYVKSSIETCVYQWSIENIVKTVDSALKHENLPYIRTYENMWRERVCRKVGNQVLIDLGHGNRLSELSHEMKGFIEKIYSPFASNLITDKLHGYISSRVSGSVVKGGKEEERKFRRKFEWG